MYGFCLELQNQRGGKVKLQSIVMPVMEFEHSEKGDALYGKQTFGKEHELFMDSTAVLQSTTVTSICQGQPSANTCLFCSAMELALALEKLTNEKLLQLHQVILVHFSYLLSSASQ